MRTLNLLLVGKTPLLLHHISRHQLRDQIASPSVAGLSLEDSAQEVMMKDGDGNPVVPVSWLWDALRVGCSRITVDGKQISFFKLQSALQLPTGNLPLLDTDAKVPSWIPYTSMQHASPGSKKSIVVVAPMFRDWMLNVQATVSGDALVNDVSLRKMFVEAGLVGIGLFHPPKKQFGQFRVSW